MTQDTRSGFDAGAGAWATYNRKPLGRIRREVTWHNLAPYLPDIPDADHPPRVLDAGGGSGELALQLVRRGYQVWLLDHAPGMLDQVRQAAQDLPAESRARLNLSLASVDDAPSLFGSHFFDVVACHTLIEYLPEPRATLGALVGLLRIGGLLSVSFVNRHAGVLRQVWSEGDPAGVLASLEDGGFCARLFDLAGMAYTAEEVGGWLADLGLTVRASCGVRAFADFVPRDQLDDPDFFEALLHLEREAATRAPYKLIARYVHLLAHKDVEVS
jgi:S-adenosylmethionine-dependent methyltransferase